MSASLLLLALCFATVLAQGPGCSAQVSLNATSPGTAFVVYYDVMVKNTGSCDLTGVFVDITLPPGDSATTYNISNTTGQLYGLPSSMPQNSVAVGGYMSLASARTPYVALKSVQCAASCSAEAPTNRPASPSRGPVHRHTPAPTTTPTETPTDPSTVQIVLRNGANPYWFAVNVLVKGEAVGLTNVKFADSGPENLTWTRMERQQWDIPTYVHSPQSGPLALPISLALTYISGEIVQFESIITSFTPGTIETSVEYESLSDD